MKFCSLALLLAAFAVAGFAQIGEEALHTNVNSRYTVETIDIPTDYLGRLSNSLRTRVQSLVGTQFDQEILDDLAQRLRREIRDRVVTMKVTRGSQPETLKIVFEVGERKGDEDVVVPTIVYHSKQNFSFGVDGVLRRDGHNLRFGILTNNDQVVERYSGLRGGYQRDGLAGGRLAVGFDVESWRSQWDPSVEAALADSPDVPGIYRTRLHLEPAATITILEPLTLQLGVSLQRLEMQYPIARHELSSAAVATLRFRRRWELTPNQHEMSASYEIRTAPKSLDSDFIFTRHHWEAMYGFETPREGIQATFQAGLLNGRAPLYDRFILGNSRTLRGWNRFDVNPIGGTRMAHMSVDYRYRILRLIYDSGSTWSRGTGIEVKHSAAVGITSGAETELSALVAFPIREGAIRPVFMMGLNF